MAYSIEADLLGAWAFERLGYDTGFVVTALQDGRLRSPDLRVRLLSSTGDTITVQLIEGVQPVDPDAVLYVERRGAYEVVRKEWWPGPRLLLTLAAWPHR